MCFSQPRSLSTVSAVVLLLATLFSQDVGARLPPKFLKAASGASKALYARGYGYSIIPIPQKFVIQPNIARREVHHGRPPRRNKRPRRGKRPPPVSYAPRYQDYKPVRKRRPPPIRDPPDYHEQEIEEDFEYDDHNYKEFDDFLNKHAELYADGYTTRGKPPRNRYKDEEGAYSENVEPIYARRRPANVRPWQGKRQTTKLYSAAIARPPPAYREEIEDEEEDVDYRRYKSNRGRYRDYDDEERYNERDEDSFYYRNRYADYNPDDFYHDRKYHEREEQFRRNAGVKTKFSREPLKERIRFNPLSDPETESPKQQWVKNKSGRKTQSNRDYVSDYEKNRWSNIFQQEATWKESPATEHEEQARLSSQEASSRKYPWRSYERDSPRGKYTQSMKSPSNNDWTEPDIITKQNQEAWEERHQSGVLNKSPTNDDPSIWIKEHSVGYGIEIDSGQKKRKPDNSEPDVVYGQSAHSKPRIPDLGYGQGMEVVDDNVSRRQIFLR